MLFAAAFFFVLQADTCADHRLPAKARETRPLILQSDHSKDPIAQAMSKEFQHAYNAFSEKYYRFIDEHFNADSVILIHRLDKDRAIDKSVIIDLKENRAFASRYFADRVHVCESTDAFRKAAGAYRICSIYNLNDNIALPRDWVVHDGDGITSYILEIRRTSGRSLCYVVIEGLDRSHFKAFRDLREDSDWWFVRSLFSAVRH